MWQRRLIGIFFMGGFLVALPANADYLTPTNVLGTSEWTGNAGGAVERLIDGSGLDVDSATGLHDDSRGAETMWHGGPNDAGLGGPTGNPPTVADQALVFDLGGVFDLSTAYVWQHNQYVDTAIDAHLNRGVDEFEILVSLDDVTYTSAGLFNLARANPGGVAGHQEPATTVPFSGSGRFVKFDINSAQSGAADDYIGLSEVRFEGSLVLTAFPVLEIDRATGAITLSNDTGGPVSFVGYSIFSETVGALDPAQWTSIADSDGEWLEFTDPDSRIDLSEGTLGTGVTLTPGNSISLGPAWIQNPTEDVEVQFLQDDGSLLEVNVHFAGNDDQPLAVGDLDFDGDVDPDDWGLYRASQGGLFPALSPAEAYQMGDLDGDLNNDLADFRAFEAAYDAANGAGSFAGMLAGIPEPSTLFLFSFVMGAILCTRRTTHGVNCLVGVFVVAIAAPSHAEYLTPTNVLGTSEWSVNGGGSAENLINGSGLSIDSAAGLHDDAQSAETMWHGGPFDAGLGGPTGNPPVVADQALVFDLGSIFDLSNAYIWQHNQYVASAIDAHLNRGVDEFEILVSTDDVTYSSAGVFNLTRANPGGVAGHQEPATAVVFSGVGQYVKFDIHSAQSGAAEDYIGLSEVRFEGLDVSAVVMEVNTTTGAVSIQNNQSQALDLSLNGYQLTSAAGSLDVSGWNSLEDQDLPNFPAGDGTGNGWEEGGMSNSNILIESYLTGFSTLAIGDSLSLGNAFDESVGIEGQDLIFEYSLDSGPMKQGVVEYVTVEFNEADFDRDGDVDGDDFLLWQGGFGTPSGAAKMDGDFDNDGDVDGDDFLGWQANFGSSGGDGATAIPEPSTLGLLGLMLFGLTLGLFRKHGRRMMNIRSFSFVVAVAVAGTIAQVALASSTNDRDYRLGDDDGTSAGNPVSTSIDATLPANDLFKFSGSPTYVDVGPSGAARPGAPSGALGVEFDATTFDYLEGDRLGLPETSSASGSVDYSGIANRGFQLWVNPGVGASAEDQHLVMDTLQHGVGITAGGNWFMQYAGAAHDSGVAVATGQWHHVMVVRPSGSGTGAQMYVDGAAVGAAAGGYNGADENVLTLAANTGDNIVTIPGESHYFTGILDDLEMFVLGTSTDTQTDYGTFNLGEDNGFIAGLGLVDGDITGDGIVMGDGSGSPADDDVAAFVENWLATNDINGVRIGDLNSRQMGDFDYSGRVDILDWHTLRANHVAPGSVPSLGSLLGGVPEPSSVLLLIFGILGALMFRRRSTCY